MNVTLLQVSFSLYVKSESLLGTAAQQTKRQSLALFCSTLFELFNTFQMAVSLPSSPLLQELRQLYHQGDYDSILTRTDTLQKRKRVEDPHSKSLIELTRAMSLIQLGQASVALPLLSALPQTSDAISSLATFAKLYVSWVTHCEVPEAIRAVSALKGNDAERLKAQLFYRDGRYADAANCYTGLLQAASAALAEKKRPASRWLPVSRAKVTPVTAAELEQASKLVNELATNAMAAQILSGCGDEAVRVKQGLRASYELEYNLACAQISDKDWDGADTSLENAETLIRAELYEEEDDLEEAIAPIRVQKAYLQQRGGDITMAQQAYADIVIARKADAASLAVAANNLTVALGQMSFGRKEDKEEEEEERRGLTKEQHDALVEGLKKMRATTGRNVETKLTMSQQRAMARNRAILLVQMGRLDACRTELAKVKSCFPDDSVVPLIESSLVARENNVETADKILMQAGNSDIVKAARVQLAVGSGDMRRGAVLLQELFEGRPAAGFTAAALLEQDGDVEGAIAVLRKLGDIGGGAARKALAGVLLRDGKYEEARRELREVCKADGSDAVAQAQLVVATSYVDVEEAERIAEQLLLSSSRDVDGGELEGMPPPKRKHIGRKVGDKQLEEADVAARAAAARERKRKKRKKRLPKNYDAEGPGPDPERWLPKTLRSTYKKKKERGEQNNFRGSQGADAAAAEAAAIKNAERSAAKAAAVAAEGGLPPSGRAKIQRKKKNRR